MLLSPSQSEHPNDSTPRSATKTATRQSRHSSGSAPRTASKPGNVLSRHSSGSAPRTATKPATVLTKHSSDFDPRGMSKPATVLSKYSGDVEPRGMTKPATVLSKYSGDVDPRGVSKLATVLSSPENLSPRSMSKQGSALSRHALEDFVSRSKPSSKSGLSVSKTASGPETIQSGYSSDIVSLSSSKAALEIANSVYRRTIQTIEERSGDYVPPTPSKMAAAIVDSVCRQATQVLQQRYRVERIKNLANEFVDSLINEALEKTYVPTEEEIKAKKYPRTKEAKDTRPSVFDMCDYFIDRILSEAYNRVEQIKLIGVERFAKYVSVDEFKVKDGLEIVARCISTWSFNPHWYFKIIYNGRSVSDTYSYFYTVRWSAPSLSYPVAQVAADIYFTIEVIPMTPPPVYIQVCYRLETDRSNRCALKTPFLEKWLHTVIRRKLEAFQMFKF